MNQNSIRKSFIDFFISKKHNFVDSAPLVPKEDSTLLFINSGMAQFKDIFIGTQKPKFKRVCNSQKCIRLSGKHNDLEEVGLDTYHHTFFEMLGSWSFGDYYKKDAIIWAWELLVDVWGLDREKLYITVHHSDDEAAQLWQSETDIHPDRIMRFGDEDNFWEMADVGPCGPCSEIHIDIGEENCTCTKEETKKKCKVNGQGVNTGCGRYIEIWNLVFIQYFRDKSGKLNELKQKSVDTGMGFERIATVLQNKVSNYDTDIFTPYIEALEKISNTSYKKSEQELASLQKTQANQENNLSNQEKIRKLQKTVVSFRVISDHLRAIGFSIADGIIPSNDGRGYVIRRLIRRAARFGLELGLEEPFLYQLVPLLGEQMGGHFGEILKNQSRIIECIKEEERLFSKTLKTGLSLLYEKMKKATGTQISGKDAFVLYDTYGFPFDLTLWIANEQGLNVNQQEFDQLMQEQKSRSRADYDKKTNLDFVEMSHQVGTPTVYLGDTNKSLAEDLSCIVDIFKDGKSVDQLLAGEKGYICFDKTIFYGEGGGQVGDIGKLSKKDEVVAEVLDTQKSEAVHFLYVEAKSSLDKDQRYTQIIDNDRRLSIRRNHSAAHLLMQSLVDHLGDHVMQAGSYLDDKKLRFDFNHAKPISQDCLRKIELDIQSKVYQNLPTKCIEMPKQEALDLGARAFFEEKYGDVVRVVKIGEKSIELCGGSHVTNSSEIGCFSIQSESSIAAGVRRIEAATSKTMVTHFFQQRTYLKGIMNTIRVVSEKDIQNRITLLSEENKKLKDQLHSFLKIEVSEKIIKNIKEMDSLDITSVSVKDFPPKLLQKVVLETIEKNNSPKPLFVVSCTENDGKVQIFCAFSEKVWENHPLHTKIDFKKIILEAGKTIGGSGGGKGGFFQAGGNTTSKKDVAINQIVNAISTLSAK